MDGAVRVRSVIWFATGVVVALLATLLVTQAWKVDAAPGDTDSTFVPVAPCRLFDMRPGEAPVTGKKTPLGAGEGSVYTQQVTGSVGSCVGIPAGATAVSMNVTIINPTAQSNLRVFPADVSTPQASSLNWLAGQSPTPNKVDVKLSAGGAIRLYNHSGTVDVLGDVVGYYINSTLRELASDVATLQAENAALAASQAFTQRTEINTVIPIPLTVLPLPVFVNVASTVLTAPVAGTVTVLASARADNIGDSVADINCIVARGAVPLSAPTTSTEVPAVGFAELTVSYSFDVTAGSTFEFRMLCWTFEEKISVNQRVLAATFTSDP